MQRSAAQPLLDGESSVDPNPENPKGEPSSHIPDQSSAAASKEQLRLIGSSVDPSPEQFIVEASPSNNQDPSKSVESKGQSMPNRSSVNSHDASSSNDALGSVNSYRHDPSRPAENLGQATGSRSGGSSSKPYNDQIELAHVGESVKFTPAADGRSAVGGAAAYDTRGDVRTSERSRAISTRPEYQQHHSTYDDDVRYPGDKENQRELKREIAKHRESVDRLKLYMNKQ